MSEKNSGNWDYSSHSSISSGAAVVVGLGLHGIGAWAPFGRVIGFSGHNGSTGRGLHGIGQRKGGLHKGVSGQIGSSGLVSTTESTRAIITKTVKNTHKNTYNFILPKFIANQSTVLARWIISKINGVVW